ncbi:phospholipid/cholesterol/gamma-HCH transport system ATP-binding protein [Cohaesibacter sp. ES.047]|uniref:ABC transporter ATP-binding protein n=1 Tax=Cohaesibacter sp. ES.047 TaxID=1798205 RepID=UPI000BB86497|nr:ATP-binding cassette domain-containing protein [Cohaesibacter sp. ES.047]SNY94306.1 phospholipid/cholesterol/gamma-HCH transport system ATP-binding protein [Cohaesibacter sp. ES.047]
MNTEQHKEGMDQNRDILLSVRGLSVGFANKLILEDLDLDVFSGEIIGIVGASGTGKSVLLRAVLGLVPKQEGQFILFGSDTNHLSPEERLVIERKLGVLFQHGALFSSLTVLQNIQVPMREYLSLPQRLMDELAISKLELVGLSPDAAHQYPSELSGGMIKRAALARALALDPDLVLLDEPTSGLDPISAEEFDELISTLRNTLGLTVFMVTHDLDSLSQACDRIAVLAERKILVTGTMQELQGHDHPWIRRYFNGKRAIRQ